MSMVLVSYVHLGFFDFYVLSSKQLYMPVCVALSPINLCQSQYPPRYPCKIQYCKVLSESQKTTYRIVASRSTCYYSDNQIFWFLKSRMVTCPKSFFRDKTFLFVVRMSWKKDTWQLHDVFVKYLFFQLIRTFFIFWPSMLLFD